MFIEQDEHLIVMEDALNPFSRKDVKMIEDAGIKTVFISSVLCWDQICKSSLHTDWVSVDRRLENFLDSNLKLILPFYYTMPNWFPNEWYLKKDPRLDHILPNYGNEEFGQAVDNFALEILNQYSNLKPRMQLTYAIPSGGEFLWDAMLTETFPVSDEVVAKFIIDRQKVLVQQHGEVWLNIHNFLGEPKNWNNENLPRLYGYMRDEFPETPFYSLQFAHFYCGITPNYLYGQMKSKKYAEEFGIRFFVGSNYCEGLTENYNAIREQKLWGFITCPMHSENQMKHYSVEPWMVETLRETNQKLKEEWSTW